MLPVPESRTVIVDHPYELSIGLRSILSTIFYILYSLIMESDLRQLPSINVHMTTCAEFGLDYSCSSETSIDVTKNTEKNLIN